RDFVYGAYHAVSTLVVEKYGVFIEDELRRRFDEGQRGDLFSTVLRSLGIEVSEEDILSLVKIYRSHTPHLYPYTDVAVIKELKEEGVRTGLISDGYLKVQQKKFCALNIKRYFDEVIFTDSFGREFWKPHPLAFKTMAEKLGIEVHEMVYVGDNPRKDFVGCRDLGMATVRIRRHRGENSELVAHSEEYAADYEIKSLLDLRSLFDIE
ncbi:MAG: HAD-IA family hydrolase, partial [Lentisphaeraceae bacterium]|nr:HAD-IA family hydrolase [Lentisphaeraceae bacterium]